MRVLASIIYYQALEDLESCIKSLKTSVKHAAIDLDILVVANSFLEFDNDIFESIKIIQNDSNVGFGCAANIALKLGLDNDYDYVFLVNQDTYFFDNTILELINAVNGNEDNVGVYSPIQISKEGVLDKKSVKSLRPENCQMINAIIFDEKIKSYYITSFVNASCWLIDASVIRKIGGFNPIYKHYGEDFDFAYRLKQEGYKIAVVPKSHVQHNRIFYKKDTGLKISKYLKENSIRNTAIDFIRYTDNKETGYRLSIFYVLRSIVKTSISIKAGLKLLYDLRVLYKRKNNSTYVEL